MTHSGVIRASFVCFGNMAHEQARVIQAENTSITEWSCTLVGGPATDLGVWRLDRYNDASHLGEPDDGRGHRG